MAATSAGLSDTSLGLQDFENVKALILYMQMVSLGNHAWHMRHTGACTAAGASSDAKYHLTPRGTPGADLH